MGLALSPANLYSAAQPEGRLFGLQFSNPVNPQIAYGNAQAYGTENDPLVGQQPGGVNVFGTDCASSITSKKLLLRSAADWAIVFDVEFHAIQ